jgi:translation initiation factor IF-3
LRTNREIRVPNVRLIGADGEQIGIVPVQEALRLAQEEGLDLVEVVPTSRPPVCKIIDYGKFRYDQTKRERESKKAQHQVKLKEIKVKPNIDTNDLNFKTKRAREFIEKGFKVRLTCMFRGREMAYPDRGRKVVKAIIDELEDVAIPSGDLKMLGRNLTVVMSPTAAKKKVG